MSILLRRFHIAIIGQPNYGICQSIQLRFQWQPFLIVLRNSYPHHYRTYGSFVNESGHVKRVRWFPLNSGLPAVSQRVHRAPYSHAAFVEHMGVNHGGSYVLVSKELLDCPDVVAILKKMCCERVPEGMTGYALHQAGLTDGCTDCFLDS